MLVNIVYWDKSAASGIGRYNLEMDGRPMIGDYIRTINGLRKVHTVVWDEGGFCGVTCGEITQLEAAK